MGDSTGKALLFEVLKASSIVRKLTVKIIDRIAEMLRNCLSGVHCFLPPPQTVCHLFYVMSRDNYQKNQLLAASHGPCGETLLSAANERYGLFSPFVH